MAPEAVVQKTGEEVVPVKVTETQEYKDAVAKGIEERQKNLNAEYDRKQAELQKSYDDSVAALGNGTPARTPVTGDFFTTWGEKHGIPADAGRELATGIIAHVNDTLVSPLSDKTKRQEIRGQRQELRQFNPKLAKLDDRFHKEVIKRVEMLRPEQIGPDSYSKALSMVIGENWEDLETKKSEETTKVVEEQREPAPGPTPEGSPTTPKATVTLNKAQKEWAEARGLTEEMVVEIQRKRARDLEAKGKTKAEVRAQLGDMIGTIEF